MRRWRLALLVQQGLARDKASEILHIVPVRLGGLFGQWRIVLADEEQFQIGELCLEWLRGGGLGGAHGVSFSCALVAS